MFIPFKIDWSRFDRRSRYLNDWRCRLERHKKDWISVNWRKFDVWLKYQVQLVSVDLKCNLVRRMLRRFILDLTQFKLLSKIWWIINCMHFFLTQLTIVISLFCRLTVNKSDVRSTHKIFVAVFKNAAKAGLPYYLRFVRREFNPNLTNSH